MTYRERCYDKLNYLLKHKVPIYYKENIIIKNLF